MICNECREFARIGREQGRDLGGAHEGETTRGYLASVLRYLQRPGDWRLTSTEATLDYALCDNMPRD